MGVGERTASQPALTSYEAANRSAAAGMAAARKSKSAVPSQKAEPKNIKGTAASRNPAACPFGRPQFNLHENPKTDLAKVRGTGLG